MNDKKAEEKTKTEDKKEAPKSETVKLASEKTEDKDDDEIKTEAPKSVELTDEEK